jgi:hypothetical protein
MRAGFDDLNEALAGCLLELDIRHVSALDHLAVYTEGSLDFLQSYTSSFCKNSTTRYIGIQFLEDKMIDILSTRRTKCLLNERTCREGVAAAHSKYPMIQLGT